MYRAGGSRMTTGEHQDPKTLKGSRILLLIGRVAYVRIGSLDESGSDGSTTERLGVGRAAWWPTKLDGGLDHRKS